MDTVWIVEGGREKEGVGDKRLWNKEGRRGETDEQAIERAAVSKSPNKAEHARVEQGAIERTSVHDERGRERGGERLRLCRFVLHHSALSNIC